MWVTGDFQPVPQPDNTCGLLQRFRDAANAVERQARGTSSCLASLPLDAYLAAAGRLDPLTYAAEIPAAQRALLRRVRTRFGKAAAHTYNRLALLRLTEARLASEAFASLPSGVRERSLAWFERMAQELEADSETWEALEEASPASWNLRFDFAVAAGRMLPVGGAWVVESRRLPLRRLFGRPTADSDSLARVRRKTLRRAASLFRRLPGIRGAKDRLLHQVRERLGQNATLFVIHTAGKYRRGFTAAQQRTAFFNVADLLRSRPDHLGLYRRSWFLDPQVARIEPRLAFLVAEPLEHGATFGLWGPIDAADRREILAYSPARRAAFEAGTYRPEVWAYLWRREDLLGWAASESHGSGTP